MLLLGVTDQQMCSSAPEQQSDALLCLVLLDFTNMLLSCAFVIADAWHLILDLLVARYALRAFELHSVRGTESLAREDKHALLCQNTLVKP